MIIHMCDSYHQKTQRGKNHCRSVDLQAVDNVVVVWHSTLSQPEHATIDCCIPVEIGMVILTLVLMGRVNN